MKTDIEISRAARLRDIREVAAALGLAEADIDLYGKYKAKVARASGGKPRADAKLILVTAMSPTPAGEGKTTTTIGLADGLSLLGKRTAAAMREPSLGPVFGVKGGATGGGYAQVAPMEEINLHFNGDFHAIESAANLLAALIDNHIHHGNAREIDVRRIVWRRAMDMNDRQLRSVVDGLGGRANGTPREDGFDIVVASEVMAVFCLAENLADLRTRLGRMIVAYDRCGQPVTAADLKANGAMTALLREAFKPNLVQTLAGTPVLVHGGPFANIAHGCNSVVATRTAMALADYTVTEAGFGADLGAEKFLDIKCRAADLAPDAVVVVATVRALKYHGGVPKDEAAAKNPRAVERGLPNLLRHIRNMRDVFGLPVVVALNRFPTDDAEELAVVAEACDAVGVSLIHSEVWARGGEGGKELAEEVVRLTTTPSAYRPDRVYPLDAPIAEKIRSVAGKIYGAADVAFTPPAARAMQEAERLGFGRLPVCIAKTQYSFSDDPQRLGAPEDFTITVRELRISAGAGFVVALTGDILTMPGLPKTPLAESIDVDEAGNIVGLS